MKKLFFFMLAFMVLHFVNAQNSLTVTVKNQFNENVSGADVYVFGKDSNLVVDYQLDEVSPGVYEVYLPSSTTDLGVFVYSGDYQSNVFFPDSMIFSASVYPPDLSSTPKVFISQTKLNSTNFNVYVPNFDSYSSISVNYGDGTIDTLDTYYTTHQFTDYGIYNISVMAQDSMGNNLLYETIIVAASIQDTMAFSDFVYGYEPNENLYYFSDLSYVSSGSINTGSWDFGDGSTYNELYAEHHYDQPGIYTVKHTITDSLGNTLSNAKRIIVPDSSLSELANIYYMPEISYLGNNKIFLNSNYMEINGSYYLNSFWISQDGKMSNRTYEYFQTPSEGIYAVKYGVNTTKHDIRNIYYTYIAPVNSDLTNTTSFGVFVPDTGRKAYEVGFVNLSKSTGEFVWDFGDAKKLNSFRSKENDLDVVYHPYDEPGTYTVKLTNTSNNTSFVMKIKVGNGYVKPIYSVQPGKVEYSVIEKANSDLLIGIYPNPASDYVKIITSEICPKNIELFSLDGKLIKEVNTSQKNISIDVNNLPQGIYILKINALGKTVSQKIVKN